MKNAVVFVSEVIVMDGPVQICLYSISNRLLYLYNIKYGKP